MFRPEGIDCRRRLLAIATLVVWGCLLEHSAFAQLNLIPSTGAAPPPQASVPQPGSQRMSAAQARLATRNGAKGQDPTATQATATQATTPPEPTLAATGGQAPDAGAIAPEAIAAQLQLLQTATDLDPTLKQGLIIAYEAILAETKKRQEEEKVIKDFSVALENAPNATADAKRRKESPSYTAPFSEGTLPFTRVEILQTLQLETTALLQAVTKGRSDVETTLATRESRRKEIPRYINDDKVLLTKLSEELAAPVPEGIDPRIREANQLLIRARLATASAHMRRLELEQRTFDAESELLPIRKELLAAEEKFYQLKLKEINEELGKRRENLIAKQKQLAGDLRTKSKQGLESESSRIVQRTDEWMKLVKEHAALRMTIDKAKEEQKRWADRYRNMIEKLQRDRTSESPGERTFAMSRMKSLVGEMLRRQRDDLPDVDQLNRQLDDYQTQWQTTQSIILSLDDWKTANPISADPSQPPIDLQNAISEYQELSKSQQRLVLEETERRIVDEFRLDAKNYSETLFTLADLNQQLIDQVRKYQSFIDEHILWIRSTDPISKGDVSNLWRSMREILDLEKWRQVPIAFVADIRSHPILYGLALLMLVVLLLYTKTMRNAVHGLGALANKSSTTSFSPTFQVIVFSVLMSAPLTFIHLLIGWRLMASSASIPFVESVGFGLLVGARYFFPLEFFRQIVRRGGLAEAHFQWSTHATYLLQKHLRWFIDLGIPTVVLIGIINHASEPRWENSLGRLAFCLLMFLSSVFLLQVLHPYRGVFRGYLAEHRGGWIDRLRFIWYFGVSLAPLVMIVMSLMGYHYTAGRLAMHLHTSIMTLLGLFLLYFTIWRWLLLQRRQLVIAQARARLEEARRRDADASTPISAAPGAAAVTLETGSDLSQINAQTIRLVSSTLIFAAVMAIAFIWSSVLPAVGALDSVTLWTVTGSTPDEKLPVTLANLLLAIPAAIMTFVAAKNLPGLLEIALLQHLPIENAVRYAITSISRYTILILGIAMTFNSLGVRWASIQWLVAALGVGLGFGLQEIFANFVSGLILLFEQPVRVGDVITIGDTTGTVSKIRMRATTVMNFDQQELVIPNKDLITGRLLNWTLSDATNRLVIEVGVAYGTDVTRACQILREICQGHPNVLKNPEPTAFFEVMADSQLTIKVRIFLASLDLRLPTRHEILTRIQDRFHDEGIEIPFPQRELRIRSLPPEFSIGLKTPSA
jgi:potassium-dependent mechanosensitive channel